MTLAQGYDTARSLKIGPVDSTGRAAFELIFLVVMGRINALVRCFERAVDYQSS